MVNVVFSMDIDALISFGAILTTPSYAPEILLKVQDEMNDLEVSFKKNEFCGS
jgi:hypothetical protein